MMKHQTSFVLCILLGAFLFNCLDSHIRAEPVVAKDEVKNSKKADKPEAKATVSQSATANNVTLKLECPKTLTSGSANYITMTVRNGTEKGTFFFIDKI